MAGVSMKDIKSRIKSMESTKQITKAMEMVAASKLRGAQERAIASRPYFEVLYQTMHDIADANTELTSPFVQKPRGEKFCFVVIAGDRGLAGGYNNNVLKLAMAQMDGRGGPAHRQEGHGVLPQPRRPHSGQPLPRGGERQRWRVLHHGQYPVPGIPGRHL